MALQVRDRGHDLGNAGLVVGAEQRRPVGGDDVVADLPLQQRQLRRVEDDALAGELDRAAVVPSWTIGSTPVPVTSGEVSTCATRPIAGADSAPGSEP